MKTILILLLLGTSLVLGFRQNQNTHNELGDIRYSIIKPDVFERDNPGWVLMAGQAMQSGWDLPKHLRDRGLWDDPLYANIKNNLPDTRGMFIRGQFYSINDGKANPDPFFTESERERRVGEYQKDAFERHTHPPPDGSLNFWTGGAENTSIIWGNLETKVTKDATGYAGTSNETRPENVSFYTYIKVEVR